MGRPDKLTPEIQKKICDAIRAGNYIETAAAYSGVHKATLYRWLKDGRKANRGKKKEFCDAVDNALAQSEISDVLKMQKLGDEKQDWKSVAWRLERRFKHWRAPNEVRLSGDPLAPVKVESSTSEKMDISKLSADELETLEELQMKMLLSNTTGVVEEKGEDNT